MVIIILLVLSVCISVVLYVRLRRFSKRCKICKLFDGKNVNSVVENVAVGVYIRKYSDRERSYVSFNKLVKEYFLEADVLNSDNWNQAEDDSFDRQVLETGQPVVYHKTILDKKDNMKFYLRVTKCRVSVNEHTMLVATTLVDLTYRKLFEAELERARHDAEKADKLKSAFLANMSHEIRTPLNAIVGFSELLQLTDSENEREEYINVIKTNNDILLRLVSDILDLSKLEAGIVVFNNEEFDVVAFFSDAVTLFKQRCQNPKVEIHSVVPYKKCVVNLDISRLSQLVTNFVTNAIKYTNEGYIEAGFSHENGVLYVYVEDTGIGIPDSKHDRVFHRFDKLESFVQGTGLGLSICKTLVDAVGGEIGFESEVGRGSKFWAKIPCTATIECL